MDTSYIQIIIMLLFILGVIGAKSTWRLTRALAEFLGIGIDSVEGFVFSIIIFIIVFAVLSPVMGVVTIIKRVTGTPVK